MNYKFDIVNNNEPIIKPTLKISGVNIILTDESGKEFGVSISIENLNIEDKVLEELKKYKV
jgi:hypothetical protein